MHFSASLRIYLIYLQIRKMCQRECTISSGPLLMRSAIRNMFSQEFISVPTRVRRTNDQEVHSGTTRACVWSDQLFCLSGQKTSMLVSPSLIEKTPHSPRSEPVHNTRHAASSHTVCTDFNSIFVRLGQQSLSSSGYLK